MTSPPIYDVHNFSVPGYLTPDGPWIELLPHKPQFHGRIVVKLSKPLLTTDDVGKMFVRSYFHRAPSMQCKDFGYIPNCPTREECDKTMLKLLKIKKDGSLLFGECKRLGWGRGVQVEKKPPLSSDWNDSYWMQPEEYLNLIQAAKDAGNH